MEPFPCYGGAPFLQKSKKVIRLILKGCVNRPFFHISVQEYPKSPSDPVIEQIGNYDPLPNAYNEKLVAVNFQRLEYWLRKGAEPTEPVQEILGLCGYFPIHPKSFRKAYLRRKEIIKELEKLKIEAAKFSLEESEKTDQLTKELSSNSSTLVKEESTKVDSEEPQHSNASDDTASEK